MKKNYRHLVVLSILAFVALGLSACERSASAPPVTAASQDSNYPVPEVGTKAPMEALEEISTLTAIAASGGIQQPTATTASGGVQQPTDSQNAGIAASTPVASTPTEAPKPTETQAPQVAEAQPQPEPQSEPQPEPEEEENQVQESYSIPDTYTLRHGEFPYCIARRFDIAPSALLSTNGLSSSSVTYPGTVLKIPKDAAHFNQGARSLRQHPTSYTVQAGDTVNSIACLFGDVDPRAIEDKNGFSGAYTLNVGQTIQIP